MPPAPSPSKKRYPKPIPVRRFPAPWAHERCPSGWWVRDASGTPLVSIYCRGFGRQSDRTDVLSERSGEAVAHAISTLPELMKRNPVEGPADLPVTEPLLVLDRTSWFLVVDAKGFKVAAVYVGDARAGNLTWDQARRIATSITFLPELLKTVSRGTSGSVAP